MTIETLKTLGLYDQWTRLSPKHQQSLMEQVEKIDTNTLALQQALLQKEPLKISGFKPLEEVLQSGNQQAIEKGQQLLAEGKAAVLLIAGGQGTRLGYEGPKGAFAVSRFMKKSLFQLFCERVLAASLQAGTPLLAAVMTSEENDLQTRSFFTQNDFFGLNPEQISFFTQGHLPFLNDEGKVFLRSNGQLMEGPDGNGDCLKLLWKSGIGKEWKKQGITSVLTVLIDNPLADPFDTELIGTQNLLGVDIAIKSTSRISPEEKMGVFAIKDKKVHVIEYSELPEDQMIARNRDGSLKYEQANITCFCFSIDFIESVQEAPLPLHLARKTVPEFGEAWKYEKFIFDLLPLAKSTATVCYPREVCYAPLKNKSGFNSLETVQAALQAYDRAVYESISGVKAPERPFELSPEFYYPTPELLTQWEGRELPQENYICGNMLL